MDIKNFYLMMPLPQLEYVRLKLKDMPEAIIEHYGLREKATPEGAVYIAIKRDMYGLPQARLLAQELPEQQLNAKGYFQSQFTPACGSTKQDPSNSHCALTILA